MSKLAFLEAVLPMVGASLKASLSHAGVGRHALLKGVAGFRLGKWVSVCVFPAVPFTRKMGGCGSVDTPLDWTWLQPSLPMQVRTQVSPLSPGVWGGESRGRSSLAFAEGGWSCISQHVSACCRAQCQQHWDPGFTRGTLAPPCAFRCHQ